MPTRCSSYRTARRLSASRRQEQLLKTVRRWNRFSKVKLNIIGFDLKPEEKLLMMALADQNYGVLCRALSR